MESLIFCPGLRDLVRDVDLRRPAARHGRLLRRHLSPIVDLQPQRQRSDR